jgi:hypothetical protein
MAAEPNIAQADELAFRTAGKAGRSFEIRMKPAHGEPEIGNPSLTRWRGVLGGKNIVAIPQSGESQNSSAQNRQAVARCSLL